MIENYSLWEHLKETDKPIFLYGTGNGGDKILKNLADYGVRITGVFASDGFVRDRYFHDFKVMAYSDVVSEYGDNIIVLLAFGTTLPSVISFIEQLEERHELIIPDVPLYGGELFDKKYYESHKSDLMLARELLHDEESRLLFDDAINFKLTGKLSYLRRTEDLEETLHKLFADAKIGTLVDCGAYKGDSAKSYSNSLNIGNIIAVEPDPKTFIKLKEYAENESPVPMKAICGAVWDTEGTIDFVSSASRGSAESGKNKRAKYTQVNTVTIDSICENISVDFIKFDIEGAEAKGIDGAMKTLIRCAPSLAVSLYHRTDDFFRLILKVHSILPEHKLILRRIPCIPMWDLTLYAIKNN